MAGSSSNVIYELDKLNRVWCNGEIIGLMKTFLMRETELNTDKMVVTLAKNPAKADIVWVKDTEGKLWRALVTTLSGICDLQTITDKLQHMMDWE